MIGCRRAIMRRMEVRLLIGGTIYLTPTFPSVLRRIKAKLISAHRIKQMIKRKIEVILQVTVGMPSADGG